MPQSQEVATQDDAGREVSTETRPIDVFKAQLEKALPMILPLLPAHITGDKFKSMVVTTVAFNPKLQGCTMPSLLRSVAELAELGLSSNPTMKEADILPVWNNKLRQNEAQARPRFGGLMKLAKQGGDIIKITAHEVYLNDHFDYEYGLNEHLEHKPLKSGDRGEMTHAYVTWTTKDGAQQFEVVDRERVEKSRAASESYRAFMAGKLSEQFCTWVVHPGEMWRKTAVHAGSKYMPKSSESSAFAKAISMAERDFVTPLFEEPREALPAPDAPPKPTRASIKAEKAAQEQQRKESVAREGHARSIKHEEPQDDGDQGHMEPAHTEPSGKVAAQPEPQNQRTDDGGKPAGSGGNAPAAGADAPRPIDWQKFTQAILGKILKAGTGQMLNAVEIDYADEIARAEKEAPESYAKITAAFAGKRKGSN